MAKINNVIELTFPRIKMLAGKFCKENNYKITEIRDSPNWDGILIKNEDKEELISRRYIDDCIANDEYEKIDQKLIELIIKINPIKENIKTIVKCEDGNIFLSEFDGKGWIGTKGERTNYFANGYVVEYEYIGN